MRPLSFRDWARQISAVHQSKRRMGRSRNPPSASESTLVYLTHTTNGGLEFVLRYCLIVQAFKSSINAHYISLLFILAIHHITIDTVTISVGMTEFMPRNCDIAADDSNMVVENELHTKYATPGRLSKELENLLRGSGFQVEVRKKKG
jgi:hypothetical protein